MGSLRWGIIGLGSGAQASLQTMLDTRGPNRAVLIGSEARVEIAPVFYRSSAFRLFDERDRLVEDFHQPYTHSGKEFEAWEVERCVAAGLTESPRMPLDETVAIHETMDAIRAQIGLRYPGEGEVTSGRTTPIAAADVSARRDEGRR